MKHCRCSRVNRTIELENVNNLYLLQNQLANKKRENEDIEAVRDETPGELEMDWKTCMRI